MDKFGKSQSVRRIEDLRFLTGEGRYVADIFPQDALCAVFFRAPVAHAQILSLDLSEARTAPGVYGVYCADDLAADGVDTAMSYSRTTNHDGTLGAAPKRPVLAEGKMRFVGEPVAMVVAQTIEQARDAAELIELDYEELAAKLDLAAGGAPLHDEAPDNLAFDFTLGDEGACEAGFARAAHITTLDVEDNRIIVNAMEPRGAFAEWDGERLHLCFGGQGVWGMKGELARVLDMPADAIRVTNPDVGGGFGMKAMAYPEYFPIAYAARKLGYPVAWMSERSEAMMSDNAGRDLSTRAEMAFDESGRILAYRIHTRSNLGAYNSQFGQMIQSNLFARVLTGPYDITAAHMRCEGIYTNTTQVDAYRGAGRPEAIYVLERLIDRAAREMGMDMLDLRRRNFVQKFPYVTISGETYDVGDFGRIMDRGADQADLAGFAIRKAASERDGKLRGLGLCYYIESILGQPHEDVKVEFTEDGARIYVGTQSNGQGHETVFRQFLADQTGIPAELIEVVQGDSDRIETGGGTGGSRSVTVQANVTLKAVTSMIKGFGGFLAEREGASLEDVSFDGERFRITGSNATPGMMEAAQMARAAGRTDLLLWAEHAQLPGRSYPNGFHAAEVEIDPETGDLRVVRYSVLDDFGNLINPMLAEGQVHGGVVQGLGQALCEAVHYDEDGQLLSATFMDYAMPRAADVPLIRFDTEAIPSTANPMGMKGCGEAGTVGALGAIANAVQDAFWERGIKQVDMPFTPLRIWEMLNDQASSPAQ